MSKKIKTTNYYVISVNAAGLIMECDNPQITVIKPHEVDDINDFESQEEYDEWVEEYLQGEWVRYNEEMESCIILPEDTFKELKNKISKTK